VLKAKRHTHIHTHTPVFGPFSGTTRVSRYQKGKTNLDFSEARDSEWQWNPLGHMQVCTSLQTDNHASTPPLSFLHAGCPSCCPTNSQFTEETFRYWCGIIWCGWISSVADWRVLMLFYLFLRIMLRVCCWPVKFVGDWLDIMELLYWPTLCLVKSNLIPDPLRCWTKSSPVVAFLYIFANDLQSLCS